MPKGHFYAASFNDDNKAIDLEKLALFASSKHHVFIDRPSSPFVNKAGNNNFSSSKQRQASSP